MRPKRYKREYAVAQTVADMKRQFVYPDEDTRPGPPFIAGAGGSAPSVVVAAVDASESSKAAAQYQCTGVGDQAMIQRAIDKLEVEMVASPAQGYRVLLTEGEYAIDVSGGPIQLGSNGGTLQGMGKEATLLNAAATSPTGNDEPLLQMDGDRETVRDLSIQGGSGNRLTGIRASEFDQSIVNCHFSTNGAGISVGGGAIRIIDCAFDGASGVLNEGATEVIIALNWFGPTNAAVDGANLGNDQWQIIDNVIFASDGFINLAAEQLTIIGNTIITGATGQGIEAVAAGGGYEVVIADNTLDGCSLYLEGIDGANDQYGAPVHDNVILEPGEQHGIELVDCEAVQLHHNSVTSVFLIGPFDGIHINGGQRVKADHNLVRGGAGCRFGLNVAAGDCHIVVGNDLGDPADYGTDALNDAGTNTRLTYPNDPTYGDNWTACGSPVSPSSP